jgi:hypothetical protein
MKFILISGLCLLGVMAEAQKDINVSFDNTAGKATFPVLPVVSSPATLVFDQKVFDGKTVYFHSTMNTKTLIADAKLGTDVKIKGRANGQTVFEVVINRNNELELKGKTFQISGNKIHLRVDNNSSYSAPINLKPVDEKKPTTPEKNSGAVDQEPPVDFADMATSPILPVYDALAITELMRTGYQEDAIAANNILSKYGDDISLNAVWFLPKKKSEVELLTLDSRQTQSGTDTKETSLQTLANSIGGLDVTNIADGFAKFIVKRTKEELSISFFIKFKEEMEKDEYVDLRTVFPATHKILMAIDEDIYNYSNYINTLREAFRADLRVLDENLPGIVENHPEFFEQDGHYLLGAGLKTSCYVASSLRHNMHAGDIIDSYPTNFLEGANGSTDQINALMTKGVIQSLQMFSASMKENPKEGEQYWVSMDKVRALVNDKDALKTFIGLMVRLANKDYGNIEYATGFTFYTAINTEENAIAFNRNYQQFKAFILDFGNKLNELNTVLSESADVSTDSLKVEVYAKYFKTTAQFVEFSTDVLKLPYIKNLPFVTAIDHGTLDTYFQISYETVDLVTSINRKRYSESVTHVVTIYDLITDRQIIPVTTPSMTAEDMANLRNLRRNEKANLFDTFIDSNPRVPFDTFVTTANAANTGDRITVNSSDVIEKLLKYGAFMASMVNAKSSDEVADVIEAAALPTGSARIKRQTPFNVSINAYCGLFLGTERIRGLPSDAPKKLNTYGITAPIGVAVSTGGRAGSFSLFLSVVDLGAITAFRFGNDEVEEVPSIKLKDIISPGIFFSYGIPKTPLSFNLGAQVGPNLREVTVDANDYSDNMYVRTSASICVDIPLLNVFTRTERRKK